MQLPVDKDLAFGDVSSQVRDRMRDIFRNMRERPLETENLPEAHIPSLGMVRIGICVMEPFLPSTRPARS